jgi:hypothetical protein
MIGKIHRQSRFLNLSKNDFMHSGFFCLIWLVFLGFSTPVQAQIWVENFSGAPPAPGWSQNFVDCDGTVGSFAGVRNNRFEVQDMEGNCCPTLPGGDNDGFWTTNPIDISMACNVSVQVSYGSIGVFECEPGGPYFSCTPCPTNPQECITNGHDQMVFEYRVDGGAWVQFGYVCGNAAGTFNSGPIGPGSTVEIRINAANKAVQETYWFDDVRVLGSTAPAMNPPADLTVCAGQNINRVFSSPTAGVTYTWTNDNTLTGLALSGTGNINTASNATLTSTQVSTITVTPRLGPCIGTPQIFRVTVIPGPAVDPIAPVSVCSGAPLNIVFNSTSSTAVYNWTNNNVNTGIAASGSGNIVQNAGLVTVTQNAIITVRASEGVCQGPPRTVQVSVRPLPVVNDPPDLVRCAGQNAVLNFSGTAGSVFEWTNDNPSIGLGASGTGNINFTTAANTMQQVATITVTPRNGTCFGNPQTITITVNPAPSVTAPPNITVCAGQPINVEFMGSSSTANYIWTNTNAAIGVPTSGTGNIMAVATGGANPIIGVFTVRATENSCVGAPQNFSVVVAPAPVVSPIANITRCPGQAVTISFGGSAGATYNWTNSNTSIGLTAASGTGNINFTASNVTTAQVSNITVTPANGSCNGVPQNFTITVSPGPTVVDPPDRTLCAGDAIAVAFSGSSPTATYSWTNSNTNIGLGASGTGNIAATAAAVTTAQTGTITVTPAEGTCTGTPQTFSVTVAPAPSVTQPGNVSSCAGQNITTVFSGSSGAVYNWTNSNTNIGLPASGTGNLNFSGTNTGSTPQTATITVTPTAGSCTGTARSFTITINPAPTVTAPANKVICSGTPLVVNFAGSSPTATYTWVNSNVNIGLPATGTGNISVTAPVVTTAQTGTLTVTPAEGSCTGTPQTFSVTVAPAPSLTQPGNVTSCAGQNITTVFSGSSGAVYNWTNSNTNIGLPASGTGNLNFSGTNTGSTPQTATITVTPTAGSCTGTARSFTITINPAPTVTAPANQVICSGTPLVVNFAGSSPTATYTWVNSNVNIGLPATGTGNISVTAPVVTTAQTGTLTVTPAEGSCIGTPQIFTITISTPPTVNDVAPISLCANEASNIVFSGTPGATFSWTNSNTSIGLSASGTGNSINFTGTVTGTTPISAVITVIPSLGTCAGPSKTFNVTVNPLPSVNPIPNQFVCAGLPILVNFSGSPGAVFNWVNSSTSTGIPLLGTGNISVTASTPATTRTSVIQVTPTANGCIGPIQTFNIVVATLPTVNAVSDLTRCVGENVSVAFTGNATTYTWTNSNTAIGLPVSGTGNINFNTAATGTATITVTPSIPGCSGTPRTFVINVTNSVTMNAVPNVTSCSGQPVQVIFTGTAGITYNWTNSNTSIGLPASGSGNLNFTANATVTTQQTATITVTPTAGACLGTPVSFSLTIEPGFSNTILGVPAVCLGKSTTLTASASNVTYLWNTGQTTRDISVTPTSNTTFTITATNAAGCSVTNSVLVRVNEPNGVTILRTTCNPAQVGTTTATLTNRFGCDSLVTIITALIDADTTRLNATTCNPTQAGVAVQRLKNIANCDSLVITTTTLLRRDTIRLTARTCDPLQAGVSTIRLINRVGCDSIILTNTILSRRDTTRLTARTCNPTLAGISTRIVPNVFGCDSTIITNTVLSRRDTTRLTARTCNPTLAGISTRIVPNVFGCDSTIITNTILSRRDTTRLTRTICAPGQGGVTTQRLNNIFGCDSLVITTTTVLPADTTRIQRVTCNPNNVGMNTLRLQQTNGCDSIVLINTLFDPAGRDTTILTRRTCNPAQAGFTQQLFNGSGGCDSLVITNTILSRRDTTRLTARTCNPALAGIVSLTRTNIFGCDSTIIVNTILSRRDTTRLARTICAPGQGGVTTQRLNNVFGCDSVVITTTTVLPADTTRIRRVTCNPNNVGMSTRRLLQTNGCDSIVLINTVFDPAGRDTTILTQRTCNPTQAGFTQQLFNGSSGCDSLVITNTILSRRDTTRLTARTCNPTLAGISTRIVPNVFGCDSTIITNTILSRRDTTRLTARTCNPMLAGISTLIVPNVFGCDSTIIINTILSRRDTTRLTARTCDPMLAGISTRIVRNVFGCDSTIITNTILSRRDTTRLTRTICAPGQGGVTTQRLNNVFGCDSLVITTTTVLPADTTRLTATTCDPVQVGITTRNLTNRTGCDSLVITTTRFDAVACAVQATITTLPATCSNRSDGSAIIAAGNGIPPFAYTWTNSAGGAGTGQILAANTPITVPNQPPGNFSVTVSLANGQGSSTYTVNIPAPGPINLQANAVLTTPPYSIRCAGGTDGSASAIVAGGTGPYQYEWSNSATTSTVTQLSAGRYTVTITDQNRCSATASVQLTAPPPIDLLIQVLPPVCGSQQADAFINLQGNAPFIIRVNGNFTSDKSVKFINGANTVQVTDRNGCATDTTIRVQVPPVIALALPPDTTINLGQSLTLTPQTNLPPAAIDTVIWTPAPEQQGVLQQTWKPLRTQLLNLTVRDTTGCVAFDDIIVYVREDVDIYIPNVFYSNGPRQNNLFTISAGTGVVSLDLLRIFDRWGNQVYEWNDPIDPNVWPGWDGRVGGDNVGVGVYVYYMKITLENGEVIERKGDVTVVR